MKTPTGLSWLFLRASAAAGLSLLALAPCSGQPALDPFRSEFNEIAGSRVLALTVLGGDYGVSGGNFRAPENPNRYTRLSISKFGGAGDLGDPKPLGDTGIGWQPRFQGSMGYVDSTISYKGNSQQKDDNSDYKTFAIQFGGGARFWFGEHLSVAPTFMGMYGHTENSYTARSAFGVNNYSAADAAGLINWDADTWTVRPAGNLQYTYTVGRTIFTAGTDFTYYWTESFHTSTSSLRIRDGAETWRNMIDVDIPLRKQLWGHELRTGGYFARTEMYDGIKRGLNTDHLYEAHGRLVLDFLGKLWKVQWIGIGASYMWGSNFDGFSFGADVAFRF